jgi:ubiquinone biosynthesis protein
MSTKVGSITITKGERYREIVSVLARHGFGLVDDEFIKHKAADRARAEHLRLSFEELGTMFIKFGQILSTRSDLLPEAYRAELAKLQDQVAPLDSDTVSEIIREDIGAAPEEVFAFFDRTPLGSASIAQVHAARLLDGREVILKVRKPSVDQRVRIDLQIVAALIEEWTPHVLVLKEYDACGLLREFSQVLLAELDYSREAANVNLFRSMFANDHTYIIPAFA